MSEATQPPTEADEGSTRLPNLPDVSYSTLASEALYRAFNRSVIIGLLAAEGSE